MVIYSMKGKLCPYKQLPCQEGYCQDCQIYRERHKRLARDEKERVKRD